MVAKVFFIAANLYTIALTVVSLIRLGKISIGSFNPTDKMLHATAYVLLVLVWKMYFIFKSKKVSGYRKNLVKICIFSLGFGMLIEVLQGTLTSYRQPDWFDILANATGILIAAVLLLIFQNLLKRLKSKISLVI